jgi:hypothetical protein
MNASLLNRLERVESRTTNIDKPVKGRHYTIHALPPRYCGESHLLAVPAKAADGGSDMFRCDLVERPGPAPADLSLNAPGDENFKLINVVMLPEVPDGFHGWPDAERRVWLARWDAPIHWEAA